MLLLQCKILFTLKMQTVRLLWFIRHGRPSRQAFTIAMEQAEEYEDVQRAVVSPFPEDNRAKITLLDEAVRSDNYGVSEYLLQRGMDPRSAVDLAKDKKILFLLLTCCDQWI